MHAHYGKLSTELKSGIEILVGQAGILVMDQNSQNDVLTNNLWTSLPTKILMLFSNALEN